MTCVCRLLVERILNIHLVPYTLPVTDRMKKLLELYCTLDDNAVKSVVSHLIYFCFASLTRKQKLDTII
jgi:hypothetical protein